MESWKDKLKLRLPAILLLAATLIFWGLYDPYGSVGPALLRTPVLADAFHMRGDTSESNGVYTLRVPNNGKSAVIRFKVDGATAFSVIRLSGSIRTDHVVEGKYFWKSARLLLIQRDDKGKMISRKHDVLTKHGSVLWTDQTEEFDIDPIAFSVEVVIQQTGKSGIAQFKGVVAQPVKIKTSFTWFRILFAIAWVFMALLYFHRCRLNHRKLNMLILLNTIAILFGTLMPGDWLGSISEQLKEKVSESIHQPAASKVESEVKPAVSKKSPDILAETRLMRQFNSVVASPQKLGHFVLFASLCFLVYCSAWLEKQHPIYYLKVGMDILLFAGVAESLQHLTMDRTPNVSDWVIDIFGLLAAFVFFLIMRFIAQFIPASGKA